MAVRNCTKDDGGPFEVNNQVKISSHCKLLSSKAMVVSVAEKRNKIPASKIERGKRIFTAFSCARTHLQQEILEIRMNKLVSTVAVLCALASSQALAQQQDAPPAPLEYLKIIRTAVILGDTDGFVGVKEDDVPKILADWCKESSFKVKEKDEKKARVLIKQKVDQCRNYLQTVLKSADLLEYYLGDFVKALEEGLKDPKVLRDHVETLGFRVDGFVGSKSVFLAWLQKNAEH